MRSAAVALAIPLLLLASSAPAAEKGERGLLDEFDWGDSRSLVEESIVVTPGFQCVGMGGHCRGATVLVDGEKLLAKFGYKDDGLFRIRFRTPDLSGSDTRNLERVWQHLIDYVVREHGKPARASEFPGLAKIQPGLRPTHEWWLEEQYVSVGVGKGRGGYFVVATFMDPKRAPKREAGKAASEATSAR